MRKIFLIFLLCTTSLFAQKIYLQKSQIQFGDGDTFTANGVIIRVLGVDTPEVKNLEHKILVNQYLGPEASEFTKKLITKSKSIYYVPFQKDRYSRTLAHVFIDDELLSIKIIEAGLGYETVSTYGDNGYPALAKQIKAAATKAGKPNFTNPMYWRRKNIKREKNDKNKRSKSHRNNHGRKLKMGKSK